MHIGELAARADVASHTIRYYEREGLLAEPSRTSGGFRDYGEDALDDLRFIRKSQSLGLSLAKIREVMEIASDGGLPCDQVRAALEERLTDVGERMAELRALRTTLRATLRRLERAPAPRAGCRCAVIEGL
jgi:DNA-binding transcriptional MerR regulator